MRRVVLAWLLATGLAPAFAQTTPFLPNRPGQFLPDQPGQFIPVVPPPGPVQSMPLPPAGGFGNAAPPAPVPPSLPEWTPQSTAELRALDKVTARTATLAGRAGETLRFGSLSILVRQCVVRPPDRPADAAAWVEIADATGGPGFKGWMLVSAPSASMLEHPGYDIRLAGCRP